MSQHTLFHPAVAQWFSRTFAAPTAPQIAGVAADQASHQRADRRAHRLGQDARRVPVGDRRADPEGAGRAAPRRDAWSCTCRRSRRCPTTSSATSRSRSRASGGTRRRSDCPTSTSARWCAPATRRRRSARACGSAAAHPRHDARIAVRAAGLGVGPPDARRPRARSSSTRFMRWRRTSGAATSRCRWSGWLR